LTSDKSDRPDARLNALREFRNLSGDLRGIPERIVHHSAACASWQFFLEQFSLTIVTRIGANSISNIEMTEES
jgi:hypothetical protein